MSAITIPAKAAPILPDRWQDERPLFFVLMIMVFLACICAIAAHSSYRAAHQWGADLRGSATVQIHAGEGEDAAALQAAVILLAKEHPGIRKTRALTDDESRALLEPWLGSIGLPESLPVPALVDLELAPNADLEGFSSTLSQRGITAEIDDHQRWGRDIDRAIRAVQILATLSLILLISATSAAAIFATQSGLAARASIINVLQQVGAAPRYIARLFIIRFARLGLLAGAAGAALSLIAALLLWLMSGDGFLPNFALGRIEIFILILAPFLAALACAGAAGFTVLRALARSDYDTLASGQDG